MTLVKEDLNDEMKDALKKTLLGESQHLNMKAVKEIIEFDDHSRVLLKRFMQTEDFIIKPDQFSEAFELISKYLDNEGIVLFLGGMINLVDLLNNSSFSIPRDLRSVITKSIYETTAYSEELKDIASAVKERVSFCIHARPSGKNECIINDYITMKFENNQSNIYIKGTLFNQCKYLLLNIPRNDLKQYERIDSIDEAEQMLDGRLHGRQGVGTISPEMEFWGHCSNIQTWVEHDYDTRILHRNLAFPMLKRLMELGDQKARKVYKEEIISRFSSGHVPVMEFLVQGGYLSGISQDELNEMVRKMDLSKLVFQDIRGRRRHPYFLNYIARVLRVNYRELFKNQIDEILKNSDALDIQRLIDSRNLIRFKPRDYQNLLDKLDMKKFFSDNKEAAFNVLKKIAEKGVLRATAIIRSELEKLTNTKIPERTLAFLVEDDIFDCFTEKEITIMFPKIESHLLESELNANDKLEIFKKFFELGSIQAGDAFKTALNEIFAEGDFQAIEVMLKNHIFESLSERELEAVLDKGRENIERIGLFLKRLKRLNRRRIPKLDLIIKIYVRKLLESRDDSALTQIYSGTLLDHLSDAELSHIYRERHPELIKKILQALNSSDGKKKRILLIMLERINRLDRGHVSLTLYELIKKADFETLKGLIVTGAIEYLTDHDRNELLSDEKCLINDFFVIYEKRLFPIKGDLSLVLSREGITDLRKVKNLDRLKHLISLNLNNNPFENLKGLGNLIGLRQLSIANNRLNPKIIETLGGLDRNGNAKEPQKFVVYAKMDEEGKQDKVIFSDKEYYSWNGDLNLSGLKITSLKDVKGFEALKNVEKIDLSHNKLKDVELLAKLPTLKVVWIQHNDIQNISCLKTLKGLEEVRCFGNRLYEADELKALENLKILDLDSKRDIDNKTYFKYLFAGFKSKQKYQWCKQHGLRGYSRFRNDALINFIFDSLDEIKIRKIIQERDQEVLNATFKECYDNILLNRNESIVSIKVIEDEEGVKEIHSEFLERKKKIISKLEIDHASMNDPNRSCGCNIGKVKGFCPHFWVNLIYAFKSGILIPEEWTLTPLPKDFSEVIEGIEIISQKGKNERLLHTNADTFLLDKLMDKRLILREGRISNIEVRYFKFKKVSVRYAIYSLENATLHLENDENSVKFLEQIVLKIALQIHRSMFLQVGDNISCTGVVGTEDEIGYVLKNIASVNVIISKSKYPKKKKESYEFKDISHPI